MTLAVPFAMESSKYGPESGRSDGKRADRLHLYPTDDLKCLWMEAGILTYRLCTRQYKCDTCSLDEALREGPAEAGLQAAEVSPS